MFEDADVIKTLTKHGNSYALVIDRPILDLLKIAPESPLEVTTDGRVLVVSPVRNKKDDAKFKAAVEMVHKRFGRTMKKLAE